MPSINYKEQIAESLEDLLFLERKATHAITRDRLRFLRLLKSGRVTTLPQAGASVGLAKSWSYTLWKRYKDKGLTALQDYPFQGTQPRLNAEQEQHFKDSLADDHTATLANAAQLIEQQSHVHYSVSGTWYVLRRMGIKKKTGRPCHFQQDAAAAEVFKKKHRS